MTFVLFVAPALALVGAAAVLWGSRRWSAETADLRARLDAAGTPVRPPVVDFSEFDRLPSPVQRYFRAVLEDGRPMTQAVGLQHTGTFNMSDTADAWKPFTSDQRVVTSRPGFDWDARIAMMPGLSARVHDAYVAGEGRLHASLFGLFSLADLRGGDDLARGELMRYFAEAAWYPTALLPSQGVRWGAVDDRSALGTLADGDVAVTLLFTFDDHGLIETVRADARPRTIGKTVVPMPWQGRFWNYEERGGMRVPIDAEVAWLTNDGPKPYWRGHITRIAHQAARQGLDR